MLKTHRRMIAKGALQDEWLKNANQDDIQKALRLDLLEVMIELEQHKHGARLSLKDIQKKICLKPDELARLVLGLSKDNCLTLQRRENASTKLGDYSCKVTKVGHLAHELVRNRF